MTKFTLLLASVALSCSAVQAAVPTERPFIWATAEERPAVLEKIENVDWANDFYNNIKLRADKMLASYTADRDGYFSHLPLDWANFDGEGFPSFFDVSPSEIKKIPEEYRFAVIIPFATDCAFLYYITGEEKYAQCALDILYNISNGLVNTSREGNDPTNGGWITRDDHLLEARYMAAMPVAYDFIAPFIKSGAKAYDYVKRDYATVDNDVFQEVFKTYATLPLESGHSGSNWSVLESTNLVHSALALDNIEDRDYFINAYLNVNFPRQDCLAQVAKAYENRGDIWPETSQYSGHVASMSTNLMYILTHYDPSVGLCEKYANVPWSLPRWAELIYPNGDIVRFGDGKRYLGVHTEDLDIAYALAYKEGVEDLSDRLASFVLREMEKGAYNRPVTPDYYPGGVSPYIDPLYIFFCTDTIEPVKSQEKPLPRTDKLNHAGLFLQRNLSSNGKAEDGLMLFVAGASHVHSHAGGMNIELYGKGEVLGVDAGNGSYRTFLHENYSRIYAAHNCVITNGKSGSNGDWVDLGTETVQKVAIEPNLTEEAISDNYSYSVTSFLDNKAPGTNGNQQRTLSIVRTSPTTGYYVDIFRADSSEPDEFHDYLYHNIAKELVVESKNTNFVATPERYKDQTGQKWESNVSYIQPGWGFFENVKTMSNYTENFNGVFVTPMADKCLNMRFFMPGCDSRDYSIVDAPATFLSPEGYEDQPTPTMVIRKHGEAWSKPFAVVYEPTEGDSSKGTIQSVEVLESKGAFQGLVVKSIVDGVEIEQYIISNDSVAETKVSDIKLRFTGRFAIVTYKDGKLSDIYAGETKSLQIKGYKSAESDTPSNFYVDVKTNETKSSIVK